MNSFLDYVNHNAVNLLLGQRHNPLRIAVNFLGNSPRFAGQTAASNLRRYLCLREAYKDTNLLQNSRLREPKIYTKPRLQKSLLRGGLSGTSNNEIHYRIGNSHVSFHYRIGNFCSLGNTQENEHIYEGKQI